MLRKRTLSRNNPVSGTKFCGIELTARPIEISTGTAKLARKLCTWQHLKLKSIHDNYNYPVSSARIITIFMSDFFNKKPHLLDRTLASNYPQNVAVPPHSEAWQILPAFSSVFPASSFPIATKGLAGIISPAFACGMPLAITPW
ncbi:MAG: hypothetical protein KKE17_12790 [Proteobacteria bacterium]|nr:hypothetical protein [Pseudomonadota bacterium]MBU1710872.1 hypothetical protein [Pseudomonadota bacterium]